MQDDVIFNIFVKEDISKPENRINLALFHLQMFDVFHNWFLEKFKLNADSIIFPVKNEEGSRPDFVVYNSFGDKIGYIEVECGINLEQFNRFKILYEKDGVKVYSIFGKKEHLPDLSLEEIKTFINSIYNTIQNNQIKLSCKYLTNLIDETIYTINDTSRKPVSKDFINSNSFIKELLSKLNDVDMVEKTNRANAGHIYYDTNKDKGFSLKVFSTEGDKKHISLLNISGGRHLINFQSEEKYRFYLQHKPINIVDEWISFISFKLKYPINKIGFNKSRNVPIETVHENIDELVNLIRKLV